MPETGGHARRREPGTERRRWLKRQAVQIAAMLPEDPAEALDVLAYAVELQKGFLAEEQPKRRTAELIRVPIDAVS